jgi:hypothetical protein
MVESLSRMTLITIVTINYADLVVLCYTKSAYQMLDFRIDFVRDTMDQGGCGSSSSILYNSNNE